MSSNIAADRVKFEKWHNEFYGEGPYSSARSLELHDDETGLGYVDPTVQAQFCAFQGAAPVVERQEPVEMYPRCTILKECNVKAYAASGARINAVEKSITRSVCHACVSLPRDSFCLVCDDEQPAPVAVVMPDRKPRATADWRDLDRGELADDAQAAGCNKALDDVRAIIDKVKELNQ